jgi:hypothetical protein|tara:strand:+ start:501 stop:1079 length:579 start_codon:yes stop_codon:yes gene_type:complete
MTYYIYCLIEDETYQIKYVGQTINPSPRKTNHKNSNKPKHTFRILDYTECRVEARDKEITLIAEHNTYKSGWNKTPGGEGFDGYSRKGIGGTKKGSIPWNKGMKRCFSEETIARMSDKRKGVRHSSKLSVDDIREIRKLYDDRHHIEGVGKVQQNGIKMSYHQAFAKKYHEDYGMTLQGLKKIVLRETWKDV